MENPSLNNELNISRLCLYAAVTILLKYSQSAIMIGIAGAKKD